MKKDLKYCWICLLGLYTGPTMFNKMEISSLEYLAPRTQNQVPGTTLDNFYINY